jgi:hypothetical protein
MVPPVTPSSSNMVLLLGLVAACTTHHEPEPAQVRTDTTVEVTVEPVAPAKPEPPEPPEQPEPAEPSEPPEAEPLPSLEPGARVQPKLSVTIETRDYCGVRIETEHLPAFNPDTHEILSLRRSVGAFRSLGTLELVRYSSAGASVITLIDESVAGELEVDEPEDDPCVDARKLLERGLASAQLELDAGPWEPMPPLPVRWLGEDAGLWRERQANLLEIHEPEDIPEEVEMLVHQRQLIVRIPGVAVLERVPMPTEFNPSIVQRIWGHRPSGTVLVATVGLLDEGDTHYGHESNFEILHWKPETLASIDRMPCQEIFHSWKCDIASAYFGGNCGGRPCEPWEL